MSKPFFSIVIPTKNHPALLRDAILSVLLQNFDDYELIISDNFNDERTKKVVDEFKSDKRIVYFRTSGEMSMPDHWEFATEFVSGLYTLILTDRAFLVDGALKDIHDEIVKSEKSVDVCFWNYDYYYEEKQLLFGEKTNKGAVILESMVLAEFFGKTLNARYLPRPHTGCYRSCLGQDIRKRLGRLYFPFAPDNVSGLLFLSFVDKIMYLPRPLAIFQGASLSNGTGAQSNPWPYFNSLSMKNPYKFVPIKAPIIGSLVFNDFLKVKDMVPFGNLKNINPGWIFYFTICYQELMGKKTISDVDKKILQGLFLKWKEALLTLDKKQQNMILWCIKKEYFKILKSYIKSSLFGDFLVQVKRLFLQKSLRKYQNIFEAAGFNKKQYDGQN